MGFEVLCRWEEGTMNPLRVVWIDEGIVNLPLEMHMVARKEVEGFSLTRETKEVVMDRDELVNESWLVRKFGEFQSISGDATLGGGSLERKPHLVKWTTVCLDNGSEGLGMKNLSSLNKSLLCKWT